MFDIDQALERVALPLKKQGFTIIYFSEVMGCFHDETCDGFREIVAKSGLTYLEAFKQLRFKLEEMGMELYYSNGTRA
jgi:uncharacterized protein (DUF302 family)